jgi:putative SOS response-associated peptidase YedK
MCGRYTLTINELDFEDHFSKKLAFHFEPKYNVLPTHQMPIITADQQQIHLAHWGLLPHQHKQPLINARSETATTLPTFKNLIQKNRCLIPADSFIEWDHSAIHQPYRIMLADTRLFCFAGLYQEIVAEGVKTRYYTIITTSANKQMSWIHDRMPLIVDKSQEIDWLASNKNWENVIQTPLQQTLNIIPISPRINGSKANDAELLAPTNAPPTLF